MLQDLSYGRLENEYKNITPEDIDTIMCFKSKSVLMQRDGGKVVFPKYSEVSDSLNGWRIYLSIPEVPYQSLFRLDHLYNNNFLCPRSTLPEDER